MEIPNKSKGEHYNLRWNSYTNNLIQVLLDHQHHEDLVDVTLCCEGQFIKAHKLVLAACSEVFQNMFKVHNVQHPMIILNGIKFNYFKHILEFMYQGEVIVLDVDLEGVLALGENLQVKGLSSIKLKNQTATELKTTAMKQAPGVIASASNLTATSNQSLLKSANNSQPQNLQTSNQPLKNKGELSAGSRILRLNEHSHFKNIEPSNVNLSTKSDRSTKGKLESILTDTNENAQRKRMKPPEVLSPVINNSNDKTEVRKNENTSEVEKNARPANAFMLFANEWRRKLAVEHPDENNKEISVRLGNMWKSLSNETKESYYLAASKMEMEYRERSPEIMPKTSESKKRKLARRKTIDSVSHLVSVDLQEYDDDDDDLQIIEVNEGPVNVSHFQAKRNQYNKNVNNT